MPPIHEETEILIYLLHRKVIQEEKDDRMNNGFTDFSQKANKKYKKTIGDFQPNLQEYNRLKEETNPDDFYRFACMLFYSKLIITRDAHSLAFITAGSSNSQRGIDKLANEIETQAKKRKEFSRRRAFDEEADVYVSFQFQIGLLYLGHLSMKETCALTRRFLDLLTSILKISRIVLKEELRFS
jgi:hypothetical protein